MVGGRPRRGRPPRPIRWWLIRISRMTSRPWGRRPSLGWTGAWPPPTRAIRLAVVLPVRPVVPISSSVILAPRIEPSISASEIIWSPVSSVMTSEIPVLIDSWMVPFPVMRWRIWPWTGPRTDKKNTFYYYWYHLIFEVSSPTSCLPHLFCTLQKFWQRWNPSPLLGKSNKSQHTNTRKAVLSIWCTALEIKFQKVNQLSQFQSSNSN